MRPLASVFTPTHSPTFLREAFDSLQRQSYQEWEWVLGPNGPEGKIPHDLLRDRRVRIVEMPAGLDNIGAIKRHVCEQCRGDALVELDHDDLLVPGETLARIMAAVEDGAGFVYTDTAVFQQKGLKPYVWNRATGWESYPVDVYGRELRASRSFPLTPRSLFEIYYCPDHVRVWSRDAYRRVGGHNPALAVCDDQDLMCRTYLAGEDMRHLSMCGYLYRLQNHTKENTVYKRNKQIQTLTKEIGNRYLQPMISQWLNRTQALELKIHELFNQGWTFERSLLQGVGAGNVGSIVADNILQYCPPYLVSVFMQACYEALVPGGYLEIQVPDGSTASAYLYPGTQSVFNRSSLSAYTNHEMAKEVGQTGSRFQLINVGQQYRTAWHHREKLPQLTFHLSALKGQRQPGHKKI